MPFTDDNNLDIPTSGVADWDSPLNGNFTALARGFEFGATAGAAVNTGDAICLAGSGYVVPHDSSSMDNTQPVGVSRFSLTSGAAGQFMMMGIVRSLDVYDTHINVGERVFVNPGSQGMLTSSIATAQHPVGWALDANAIQVAPHNMFPLMMTDQTCGEQSVGSGFAFSMDVGHRGWIRKLRVIGNSVDAYKVRFWSGSGRVASELLFETLTTSVDGGASDFDITSLDWTDAAGWGYEGTDSASASLIFGTIDVQSASQPGSGTFHVTLTAERFG